MSPKISDDERHEPLVSEELKSKRVEENQENTDDIKHGLGINLEVKEKQAEIVEDVDLMQSQEINNEKTQQIAETEWICEKCNSLNLIIYDDNNSCYCSCKCIIL